MDRVPLLVPKNGSLFGKRYEIIEGQELVLGREASCDIHIDDAKVSRNHATIRMHNSSVWVKDSGSRNGVFIDGKRVVRPMELSVGKTMLIEDYEFELEIVEIEPDDPSIVRSVRKPIEEVLPTPKSQNNNGVLVIALAILVVALGIFWMNA